MHKVREEQNIKKRILVIHQLGEGQLADFLTKPLARQPLESHLRLLGLQERPTDPRQGGVLEQGLVTLDPLAPLTDIFTEEDGRQQDAPAEEQQQSKETSPEAADNNNTSREEAPATGVAPAPASPSGAVGLSHDSSSVGETA